MNILNASAGLRLLAIAAALLQLATPELPAQTNAQTPAPLPAGHPTLPTGQLPAGHVPVNDGEIDVTKFPTAAGGDLEWQAPAAFQTKPTLPLRIASYRYAADGVEADLSISAFPGATGGLGANLNRWRGQVGLAPLQEEPLRRTITPLTVNGLQLVLVDYSGPSVRLIGAVVPHGDSTWFFKLVGPPALLDQAKPRFLELLGTVRSKPVGASAHP